MERITHAMRRERWKQIVQECNQSGMKKKDWLEEHNISPKLFYEWQRKLRMEMGTDLLLSGSDQAGSILPAPVQFEAVTFPEKQPASVRSTVILRSNKISIEINEDISDDFLLRIMKAASHV